MCHPVQVSISVAQLTVLYVEWKSDILNGVSTNLCENRFLQSPSSETPKRITKKDFGKAGSLKTAAADPNDPLSQLDPLWSLK